MFRSAQASTLSFGYQKQVDSSVLFRANEKRDRRIFADFGNYLIRLVRSFSIYEIMQVLNVSLFDKTPLRDLLNANNYLQIKQNQNFKEQLLF
jgi:hypothetical protein